MDWSASNICEDVDQSPGEELSPGQDSPEPDSLLPQPAEAENPSRRRSYTREKKLLVLKYYRENGCNKYKTLFGGLKLRRASGLARRGVKELEEVVLHSGQM